MSTEVSIAQAKSGFAALVARAEAGERIIVTRNGRRSRVSALYPTGSDSSMGIFDITNIGRPSESLGLR